jgi:hypothetical protein
MSLTMSTMLRIGPQVFGSSTRWQENTTSSALSSRKPLWNRMPRRREKVHRRPDVRGNRVINGDGAANIPLDGPPEVGAVLDDQRRVEAEHLADIRQSLRGGGLFQEGDGRILGQDPHGKEDERLGTDRRRNRAEDAPENVLHHQLASPPILPRATGPRAPPARFSVPRRARGAPRPPDVRSSRRRRRRRHRASARP